MDRTPSGPTALAPLPRREGGSWGSLGGPTDWSTAEGEEAIRLFSLEPEYWLIKQVPLGQKAAGAGLLHVCQSVPGCLEGTLCLTKGRWDMSSVLKHGGRCFAECRTVFEV